MAQEPRDLKGALNVGTQKLIGLRLQRAGDLIVKHDGLFFEELSLCRRVGQLEAVVRRNFWRPYRLLPETPGAVQQIETVLPVKS